MIPGAVFEAVAVGTGLALDLTPLRHRTRVGRALRAVACVPGLRWGAALPLAAVGALAGLVAEVVVRLVADPAELLSRHGRALASWDAARHGGGGEDLERCTRDEAPPRLALPVLAGVAP